MSFNLKVFCRMEYDGSRMTSLNRERVETIRNHNSVAPDQLSSLGSKDRCMDGQSNEWMDGWINERIAE